MYKIKRNILLLLLFTIFTVLTFAELPQAPNMVITENPDKPVTTVTASKNREHAEMNITVNKINIKEIEGIELPTGEILLFLSSLEEKKDKMRREEVYYVTDSIENFPDISTTNGKRIIANLQKLKDSVLSNGIKVNNYGEITIIDTDKKYGELYIGIVDKLSGDISKIWKINSNKYEIEELKGNFEKNALVIDLRGKKELSENLKKKKIKIFPFMNKENGFTARTNNSMNISYEYKENNYKSGMGYSIDELNIKFPVGIDKGIILDEENRKIYIARGVEDIDPNDNNLSQYVNLKEARYIEENGKYYIWVGNYRRVNRAWGFGGADFKYFNFSFDKDRSRVVSLTFVNQFDSSIRTERLIIDYENPDQILIAGENPNGMRNAVIRSSFYSMYNLPDIARYGLNYPKRVNKNPNTSDYGWGLAFKLRFEIPKELYDTIKSGVYTRVLNSSRIEVGMRGWNNDPNDDRVETETLLIPGNLNTGIIGGIEEKIDFSNTFVGETVSSKKIRDSFPLRDDYLIEIEGKRYSVSSLETTPIEVGNKMEMGIRTENGSKTFYFTRKEKDSKLSTEIVIYASDGTKIMIYGVETIVPWIADPQEIVLTLNSPLYSKIGLTEGVSEIEKGDTAIQGDKEYNLGSRSGTFWKINDENIGTRLKFHGDSPSRTYDDNVSTISFWKGPTYGTGETKVELSTQNLKAYFEILNWDLKAQDIRVGYESVHYKQDILIKIPTFNGLDYLDKENIDTGVDYSQKQVMKESILEDNDTIGSFNVRTPYYNLKALGEIDGHSAFAIRIPKTIMLEATDDVEVMNVEIGIEAIDNKSASVKVEKDGYIYFYPKSTGDISTAMDINIKLKQAFNKTKSFNKTKLSKSVEHVLRYYGTNLKLVEVGVEKKGTFIGDTAIDNLTFRLTSEIKSDNIEFEDDKIGTIKESQFTFLGVTSDKMLTVAGRSVLASKLMSDGQELSTLGVKVRYDINSHKFTFEKIKNIGKSQEIEIGLHLGSDGFSPIAQKMIFNIVNREYKEVEINLDNPIVSKNLGDSYGSLRIKSNNGRAIGEYLDATGNILSKTIKNGQYNLDGKIIGDVVNFQTSKNIVLKHNGVRESLQVKADGTIDKKYLEDSITKLAIDYESRNGTIEGLEIYLEKWDYKSKTIEFVMVHDTFVNKYTLRIPNLVLETYLDKTVDNKIDYSSKIMSKVIQKYLGNIEIGSFTLGLKEQDLRVLRSKKVNVSALHIKIPKQTFNAEIQSLNGDKITDIQTKFKLGELRGLTLEAGENYYFVHPNNEMLTDKLQFDIKVELISQIKKLKLNSKTEYKIIIPNTQIAIALHNVGVGGNNLQEEIIVNQVEFIVSNKNYEEIFDMTTEKLGALKEGENNFILNDSNSIEIYDENLLKTTLSATQLKTNGYTEGGLTLKYDINSSKLVVTRDKGEFLDKNYTLIIKENGLKIREVKVTLKNRLSFEIIGEAKLDFGDFFQGDIKYAENIIKFKNNEKAKIQVELKSTTGEMTLNGMATSEINKKVQLSEFKIFDLNTKDSNENSFRIRGRAESTPTTEVGEYKGLMEVIITILPE